MPSFVRKIEKESDDRFRHLPEIRKALSKAFAEMGSRNHLNNRDALDLTKDGHSLRATGQWTQMGECEEKKAAVHAEMERVDKLPGNSKYATHRMRVLNKILRLMSIQRTTPQDEELELLFAGLSL
ncbi:hypothetical protein AAC387_Pa01g4284 [Persea americana]